MTYAQEKSGQRLHLVREVDAGLAGTRVENRALCGKRVRQWRMTCNLPLASGCKNCYRVLKAQRPND